MKPYRIALALLLLALAVSSFRVVQLRGQLESHSHDIQLPDSPSVARPVLFRQPESRVAVDRNDHEEGDESSIRTTAVELLIHVDRVEPQSGPIQLALFNSASQFPDRSQAFRVATFSADDNEIQARLSDLSPGEYAVAVFQDSNDDGVLGRNAFGIPTEPYGFSNNARGRFGPPTFQAARLTVKAGQTASTISLR